MALTDEDKAWLSTQLGTLRAEFSERIEKTRAELSGLIEKTRTELSERNEKTETTLLTEFHKWASPMEARQRTHSAALKAIDAEMEYLSDRVTKLEGKKAS
jgi:hypothetical protein